MMKNANIIVYWIIMTQEELNMYKSKNSYQKQLSTCTKLAYKTIDFPISS